MRTNQNNVFDRYLLLILGKPKSVAVLEVQYQ